jgi:serine protease AprX
MDENYGRPSTYIECMQFFLAPTDLSGNNPDPDRRADVVGNSYGCPPEELCAPNSLHTALENMRAAGIFMSVAAGNAGPNCGTINDPPALDAASITVGATSAADAIANFSSRGPVTMDGSNRPKPELVAPGVSVYSAYPPDSYLSLSGTSMAAPHVAGAVALLWSAFPQVRGNVDYTLSVLEQSAVHLTTNQGCGGDNSSSVPNHVFGYGRIDVLAAFHFIADHPALELKLEGNSLTVSWPSPSTTFRLQQSTDRLTWSDVEQATVDNGTVRSVTISSPGQTLFFRLTR